MKIYIKERLRKAVWEFDSRRDKQLFTSILPILFLVMIKKGQPDSSEIRRIYNGDWDIEIFSDRDGEAYSIQLYRYIIQRVIISRGWYSVDVVWLLYGVTVSKLSVPL
jgi:hypothetical protein